MALDSYIFKVADPQPYRIEELNPFQEWHHHGSANDQEDALRWADALSQQIQRSVRVLNRNGDVLALFRIPSSQ